ncbi:MAG: AI-2E family transporter [Cyanobacteria bacterium]|nr:AI-2E family transporter [Cyanobacteria bacterium CG_2015-16_32_12]NCO77493.1 AI-2E family transporter [Cyanobacteria bacterium CG_2015-22_32_23]NCQ04168.1 AI-2E family transporter [Cyanobacteria bacterium CG_2015-09_32_10]NCQ42565.1 AI-2E family transporter [Cyanobacteria bacterium CG_2015-04_32_10]NCS84143.1 AI-2E family transporter [Cyanobacteria bacterium CG_2015-02_32_10]
MNFGQSLGFLSFLISLYIIWEIRQFLLLIFTAIIFAVVLNRLVIKLQQFNLTRVKAILIIMSSLLIIISLLFTLILPPFIEQFQLLIQLLPSVATKITQFINTIDYGEYKKFLPFNDLNNIINQYTFNTPQIFNNFIAIFSNVFIITFQIIILFLLTIVFLLNPKKYRYYLIKICPSFYRYRIDDILNKSEIAIVSWLNGIIINCIFIGVLSGLGLWILQVKLVLVHGLLAGLLNFIPNIGPTSSVIFPVMIALVDDPWKIMPIVIWYFIVQNIESYWLTPRVMAEKVSLLPAVTLFAQIFFATAFGIFGLLLALPLTVVAKTWIEEILFQDILDKWEISEKL